MYEFKKTVRKQRNPDSLPAHLRYLWDERVAICTCDGNVSQQRAEDIAWEQVEQEIANQVNN